MNKLFLRILMGLTGVIAVLVVFSVVVFNLTNSVREEHYWHDLVAPYLQDLNVHREWMEATKLPSSLQLLDVMPEGFERSIFKRLEAGQVIVELSQSKLNVMRLLEPQIENNDTLGYQLVLLESEAGGDQLFEFIAWYFQHALLFIESESPSDDLVAIGKRIEVLQERFDVTIEKVSSDDFLSSSFMLEQIAAEGYVKADFADEIVIYVNLDSGLIYRIVIHDLFSILSVPVLLFLTLCSLIAVALLALSFVQSFDRRIRVIETAASRISRGELDARVTSAGEEDAISRLGKSFNSMADHIQRLMYVQKEMIHAVSHELRTPVARIRFGVQMIEDCQTPESVQKQVMGIDGDIQELDELIDEILTYARLEQGGPILAFQQADVAAIVQQVVSEQSTGKMKVSISAEFKPGSDIWKEAEIETRYIHRSIQNLVGNAKRYADSKVKVICSFDAETCRIDVEDDGPGIPEEQWESVFTPFARLDDSRTRSSGGYGLGLSIVRRILYWHGGQAFLGRSSMGGAKFSLVWPRKQAG